MVLTGQMDYPAGHPQPGAYNAGYGGYGPGYGQPYQPASLGGYPYMGHGKHGDYSSENAHYNGNEQVRLYPNSVAPLPSKHQIIAPEGYNKHSYDHGIKPQGYNIHGYEKPHGNSHGYEKPSKNDYYGNSHGYEKPSKNDYYGSNHGDYEKHSKTDYYGNGHGSNGYYGNPNRHGGYENGKYPSHGGNRVESMSYNYYSSDGQENTNGNWILKGLDD